MVPPAMLTHDSICAKKLTKNAANSAIHVLDCGQIAIPEQQIWRMLWCASFFVTKQLSGNVLCPAGGHVLPWLFFTSKKLNRADRGPLSHVFGCRTYRDAKNR